MVILKATRAPRINVLRFTYLNYIIWSDCLACVFAPIVILSLWCKYVWCVFECVAFVWIDKVYQLLILDWKTLFCTSWISCPSFCWNIIFTILQMNDLILQLCFFPWWGEYFKLKSLYKQSIDIFPLDYFSYKHQ